MDISGRKLFVKALKAEGVDTIFAYPGGTVTDLFDELYKTEGIRVVLPRHEQALVHEAEGYARATGKPGVCLVTSGPGATNTITAIADAFADAVPLVVFTGQVQRSLIGNDAFQEVDIIGMVKGITKYSKMVREREELGDILKTAFYVATSGKPGPVLIDFPKDVQVESGPPDYPESVSLRGYKINEKVHIGQLKKALKLLYGAKKPIIMAGGGVRIAKAGALLEKFATNAHVPVVTTVMGKGIIDEDCEYYIGSSGMHGRYSANKAVMDCDVLFSIGCRFNDRITGDLNEFAPNARIVHLDIDTASISRNVVVDVPIVADAKLALKKMCENITEMDTREWMAQIGIWENENPLQMVKRGGMNPQQIMESITEVFGDAIYVTDVGQHQMWASQYIKLHAGGEFITSGGLGTMGFGFPAALGAKLGAPKKNVVCITGDGGFQMNMQELATAIVNSLPITICLINNNNLGMVKQMQTMFYGKRYEATCLRRRVGCLPTCKGANEACPPYVPDFVKLMDAYGAHGIRVETAEEMLPALEAAKKNTDAPTLIEFMISDAELVLPMVKGGNPMSEMIL